MNRAGKTFILSILCVLCCSLFILSDNLGVNAEASIGDDSHGYGQYIISDDSPKFATLVVIDSVGLDGNFTVPLYIDTVNSTAIYDGAGDYVPVTTIGNGSDTVVALTVDWNIIVTRNVKTMAVQSFSNSICTVEFCDATGIEFNVGSLLHKSEGYYEIPDGCILKSRCFNSPRAGDVIRIGSGCSFIQDVATSKFFPRLAMSRVDVIVYSDTPISQLLSDTEIQKTNNGEGTNHKNWVYSEGCQVWENVNSISESLSDIQRDTYFHGYFIDDGETITTVSKIISDGESRYYLKADESAAQIVDWDASTWAVENGDVVISISNKDSADVTMMLTVSGQNYYPEDNGTISVPVPVDGTIMTISIAQWTVRYMDGDNVLETVTVNDGDKLTVPEVPIKDGSVFKFWRSGADQYDFNKAVRDDFDLFAEWEAGLSYNLDLNNEFGSITVVSGTDANGKILDGSTLTVSFDSPEKFEVLSWDVGVGQTSKTYSESDQDDGITISEPLKRTLTIANVQDDITVSVNALYLSESNSPEPVVTTDMPLSASDTVYKWKFGGGLYQEGMVWVGGMSDPLVIGDFIYVRDGQYLYKLDSETGNVLATAPSEMRSVYYHHLGYIGQGRIVDYYTEKVYDGDLNYLNYKLKDWSVYDDETGCFYTIGSDVVCKYSSSASVQDGYLVPEWTVDLSETSGEVTTKYSIFTNYDAISQPIILGDTIYWVSPVYKDVLNSNGTTRQSWDVYLCYTSGTDLNHVELTKLEGKLLDNGWLTTDGKKLYLTSYSGGLTGTGTVSILAVYDSESAKTSYYSLNANNLASAFIPVGDIAFFKGNNRILVYNLEDIECDDSQELKNIEPISNYEPNSGSSFDLDKSHGSIVVNTSKVATDGKVYVYYAGYTVGVTYICEYDVANNQWTHSKMNDSHTYCSQGIRTTASGDFIYYDDSHQLFCYTKAERNNYWFFIADGNEAVMVEAFGIDAAEAANSTELIVSVDGLLYGAKCTALEDYSEEYTLYALVSGVWIDQSMDFLSGNNYTMWALVNDPNQLPSNNVEVNMPDGSKYTFDYVAGHMVKAMVGDEEVISVPIYEGMILPIDTGIIVDAEMDLEDVTNALTVTGIDLDNISWSSKNVSGDQTKMIIVMTIGCIPDQDLVIYISEYYGVGYEFTVDNLIYSVADPVAKTAKVVGYESEPVGTLEILDSVEYYGVEYGVISVARAAFVDCVNIKALVLHVNTELHAFYRCYGLESVTVCEGVASIGVSTFAYSDAIKHVELPSTLEEVGVNAFYKYSFYGMEGAKLARTAENLAGKTFEGSSKVLRESFVAGGLKYSFQGSLSVKLTGYTEEPAGELVVPSSVEYRDVECTVATVAKDAFRGCTEITSVVLGANAALHAFYKCTGIASLTVGEDVTSIGTSAFAYCTGLESIEIQSDQIAIGTNAFYGCSNLKTIEMNDGVNDGVTSIGTSAFSHCYKITHVQFSSALTKMGANAFYKIAFYGEDGTKLKAAGDLAGKTFEGEPKKLYQISS